MRVKIKYVLMITIATLSAVSGQNYSRIDWISGKLITSGISSMAINENGSPVDMETGKVISISEARTISAKRSREKAVIEAVQIINELQVDSTRKVKDLIMNDASVRQNIVRVLEEYSHYKDRPSGYLTTATDLELNLGFLLSALNINFPSDSFPLREDIEISTEYTSLIVDVRGLGIRPMLLPSILNEDGLEIFSKNFIKPSYAVKYNMVSYVYNEKNARSHKKSGKHPLFCAALKNMNGNPVISNDEIKKIFSSKKNIEYLQKCRVIFIIDR